MDGQIFGMANYLSGPIYYWLNISVLKSHIDWRSKYCLVQFVWKIETLQLWKFFLEEWVWENNYSKKKYPDDALCSNFENNPSQQLKRYRSRNLSLFLPCKNKKRNKEPAGGLDLYFHPCQSLPWFYSKSAKQLGKRIPHGWSTWQYKSKGTSFIPIGALS